MACSNVHGACTRMVTGLLSRAVPALVRARSPEWQRALLVDEQVRARHARTCAPHACAHTCIPLTAAGGRAAPRRRRRRRLPRAPRRRAGRARRRLDARDGARRARLAAAARGDAGARSRSPAFPSLLTPSHAFSSLLAAAARGGAGARGAPPGAGSDGEARTCAPRACPRTCASLMCIPHVHPSCASLTCVACVRGRVGDAARWGGRTRRRCTRSCATRRRCRRSATCGR